MSFRHSCLRAFPFFVHSVDMDGLVYTLFVPFLVPISRPHVAIRQVASYYLSMISGFEMAKDSKTNQYQTSNMFQCLMRETRQATVFVRRSITCPCEVGLHRKPRSSQT